VDTLTGTLVWYYVACQRQCWLIAHEVNADQDNELLDLGRQLHEQSYQRERKELTMPGMKIDVLKVKGSPGSRGSLSNQDTKSPGNQDTPTLVVCEVKKSDRFLRSAVMQLCFYLWRLKQQGVTAKGELLIPRKKKRIPVELTDAKERELERMMREIEQLVAQPKPPAAVKGRFCKKCAYEEFCFS
jgi:CRISPR-associated exonuclease Cas4